MFAGGPITEISHLAAQIAEESGGTCGTTESSKGLDSGRAQEYHFLTDPQWGFVAAGTETSAETIYPGRGTVVVEPGSVAVFRGSDLAGIVSASGGRIGCAAVGRNEDVAELEQAMLEAFRVENDMLTRGCNERRGALAVEQGETTNV